MKNKYKSVLFISFILSVIVLFAGLMLGTRSFSFGDIFGVIIGKDTGANAAILFYSRIPRVLASFFSGAALAVAGVILQNVLSNKLASPNVIGVNAGAGLGVTLCSAFGILSGWGVSLFAFGGSLIAVLILSLFASRTNASKTSVILGGVALNCILGAFSESIAVLDEDVTMLTTEFRVGGFSSVSYVRLIPALIMIIVSFVVLFTLFNELDVVSLGDETAGSIGLNVKKYRIIFLILASLLAGAAVSFSGLLGFVGLIVPHFVRKIVGNESKKIVPMSILVGGTFVCLCDTLSRAIFAPYELPVGILMAIIGGPVFAAILVKMKGGRR